MNLKNKPFLELGFLVAVFGLGIVFNPLAGVTNTLNQNSQTQNLKSSAGVSSIPSGDSWPMFRDSVNHTASTSTTVIGGSGAPIWSFITSGSIESSSAIANGCVYVGSDDDNVYCLNALTGTKDWSYTTGGYVISSPAVAGGNVYIGGYDDNVYCLYASNGSLDWNYTTGNYVESSPAVVNGYVYIGSFDDNVYCLNALTGAKVWNYTTGGGVYSSPAVVNGYVYVGSDDNQTYCLNALTGTKVWNYTTDGYVESSPAVANGYVYVGSYDKQIYCLNALTGTKLWNYTTGDLIESSPAVFDGDVYVGSYDGYVYCIGGLNGSLVWKSDTNGPIQSSPAISNGMVFIGSLSGSLYTLNAYTGILINTNSGYTSIMSSPAIQRGYIYVGDNNHDILCLPMANPPTAPQNLNAISGLTSVELTWSAPSDNGGSTVTGYKIYRSTALGNETYLTTLGNVLNYNDTGLTGGLVYFYEVSAINLAGESPNSTEKSVEPVGPSSAPQNLAASTSGNSQVLLTWSAPSNNGGLTSTPLYYIYRGTTIGAETFLANAGMVLSYTDTNVTDGQTYYYKICALNPYPSPNSTEVSATPYGTPSAPQNLNATIPGSNQIKLSWSAPSSNGSLSIAGYYVYRGTTSSSYSCIASLGHTTTNYTDTGLTAGQTYYYEVSAYNSKGDGSNSSVSATVLGTPGAPENFSASTGNAQVILSWTAPANNGGSSITYYNIYRSNSSGTEVYLTHVLGSSYNYTDTGLTNGQIYYYKICAENSMGNGTNSTELNITPNIVAPGVPQNLTAMAGNGKVVLTWAAPLSNGGSAVTNYKIYRSTASGNETLITTIGNVTTYTDSNVKNGQIYYYKVRTVNSLSLISLNSTEVHTEPIGAPSAPQNLIAQVGNGKVILTWVAPLSNGGSKITGYNIYRGTSSGAEILIATVGNVLTYTDTNVTSGHNYYYTVSAINSIGTGLQSPEASVTAQSSTSPKSNINGMGVGVLLAISMLGVALVIFRMKKHLN